MSDDISKSGKIILKRISKTDGRTTSSTLYKENKAISEAYGSQKSLSNSLRELADKKYLERERDGKGFEYWLADKGQKFIRNLKKRERERKKKEDNIFEYEDGVEVFVDYFEENKKGKEQIRKAGVGRNYVYLDYKELEKFNVELADDLLTDPDRVLDACREAVSSLPEIDREPNVRVKNVSDIEVQSISDLSAKDVGKMVTVEGVVQSVSKPGSIVVSSICQCKVCGQRYQIDQRDNDKVKTKYKCECDSNNFTTIKENHKTVRFLRIKEKPNKRSRDKMVAVLEGDLADDDSKNLKAIGSGIKVTGYLETHKKRKNDEQYSFRLKCNNLELQENKWNIEDITEEEKEKIEEVAQREDVFEYLSKSLAFEEIKNQKLLKKSFLVWLLGRTNNFGNLHVLTVGDPGTGKSHLASYIEDNFGKVIKAVATGATEVGLTASVVKDEVTGEYTAEGGSIPMADNGFHITDEIDELDKDHYSAFNEALSDQQITLAKANIHAELSADVSEYSVGNPKGYSFDSYEPKYKQIPIDKEDLKSRFGLILAVESNSNDTEESIQSELEKADHILSRAKAKSFDDDYLDEDLLCKFVYYAQRIYPVIDKEAHKKIKQGYISLFKAQDEDDNFIKPRHCNALAVLSIAFARMELSSSVEVRHVESALEFFRECYSSIDFEIGRDSFSDIDSKNTRVLREIKQELDGVEGNMDVQDLVENLEFDEDQVEDGLDSLMSEGEVFEPEPGKVKVM